MLTSAEARKIKNSFKRIVEIIYYITRTTENFNNIGTSKTNQNYL